AGSLWGRRPRQRLGAAPSLSGNLDAPVGEVVSDLDLDRRELDSAHLLEQPGEPGRPAARLPAEDRLERFALGIVGALVDEEPRERVVGLAGPDVPYEGAHHHNVQPIERHVAVVALPDTPGEDAVALVLVGGLSEGATAGHPAPTHVKPITNKSPAWYLSHRLLLKPRLAILSPVAWQIKRRPRRASDDGA